MPAVVTLQILHELVGRDPDLFQNAAQRADGQFAVQRHNAAHLAFESLFLEHNVAAALSNLDEAQAL
jgi:hypothetical protein